MTTIIDTDALIGLMVSTDEHYSKANLLREQALGNDARIFFLPATLGEFGSVAADILGLSPVQKAARSIAQGCTLLSMDDQIVRDALSLYYQQASKKNSLFDCYILTAARHHGVDCIFSFDKWYRENGMMLIEDFLRR